MKVPQLFLLLVYLQLNEAFHDKDIALYHPAIQSLARFEADRSHFDLQKFLLSKKLMLEPLYDDGKDRLVKEIMQSDYAEYLFHPAFENRITEALENSTSMEVFERKLKSKYLNELPIAKLPKSAEKTKNLLFAVQAAKQLKIKISETFTDPTLLFISVWQKIKSKCEKREDSIYREENLTCVPKRVKDIPRQFLSLDDKSAFVKMIQEESSEFEKRTDQRVLVQVFMFSGDRFLENAVVKLRHFSSTGEETGKFVKQEIQSSQLFPMMKLFFALLNKILPRISMCEDDGKKIANFTEAISHSFIFESLQKNGMLLLQSLLSLLDAVGFAVLPLSNASHSIIVSIELHRSACRRKDTFTFKFFNTGDGMDFHSGNLNPLTFLHVPMGEIPDMFWLLLCRLPYSKLIQPEEDMVHFYKLVVSKLPEKYLAIPKDCLHTSGQVSGSCSIKSLQLFSKYMLGETLYRRIIYLMKAEALTVLTNIRFENYEEKAKMLALAIISDVDERLTKTVDAQEKEYAVELHQKLFKIAGTLRNVTPAKFEPINFPHFLNLIELAYVAPTPMQPVQLDKAVSDYRDYSFGKPSPISTSDWIVSSEIKFFMNFMKKGLAKGDNPCEWFDRFYQFFTDLNRYYTDTYTNIHKAVAFYGMFVTYEACERMSKSPLAGLLDHHLNNLHLQDDYESDAISILKWMDSMRSAGVFSLKFSLDISAPIIPSDVFIQKAWTILQDLDTSLRGHISSFEGHELPNCLNILSTPVSCNGTYYPSKNYYRLRKSFALMVNGLNSVTEIIKHDIENRRPKLIFFTIIEGAIEVGNLEHQKFDYSIPKTIESSSFHHDISRAIMHGIQFPMIGLISFLNLMKRKVELWSSRAVQILFFDIISRLSFDSERFTVEKFSYFTDLIFSYFNSNLHFCYAMIKNHHKERYIGVLNQILIFMTLMAFKVQHDFLDKCLDIFDSYATFHASLGWVTSTKVILPGTLFMTLCSSIEDSALKRSLFIKYAVNRNTKNFFENFFEKFMFSRMLQSIQQCFAVFGIGVLNEISRGVCGDSENWVGHAPLFYSEKCIVSLSDSVVAPLHVGLSTCNPYTASSSQEFKEFFSPFFPKVSKDCNIISEIGKFSLEVKKSVSSHEDAKILWRVMDNSELCSYMLASEFEKYFPFKVDLHSRFFGSRHFAFWNCPSGVHVDSKVWNGTGQFTLKPLFTIASDGKVVLHKKTYELLSNVPSFILRHFMPHLILPLQNEEELKFLIFFYSFHEEILVFTLRNNVWRMNEVELNIDSNVEEFEYFNVIHDGKGKCFLPLDSPSHSIVKYDHKMGPFGKIEQVDTPTIQFNQRLILPVMVSMDLVKSKDGALKMNPKTRYETLVYIYFLIQANRLEKAFNHLSRLSLADMMEEQEYRILGWITCSKEYFEYSPPMANLISVQAVYLGLQSFVENFQAQVMNPPKSMLNRTENIADVLNWKSHFANLSSANGLFHFTTDDLTLLERNLDHLPLIYRKRAEFLYVRMKNIFRKEYTDETFYFKCSMKLADLVYLEGQIRNAEFFNELSALPFSRIFSYQIFDSHTIRSFLAGILKKEWKEVQEYAPYLIDRLIASAQVPNESKGYHCFAISVLSDENHFYNIKESIAEAKGSKEVFHYPLHNPIRPRFTTPKGKDITLPPPSQIVDSTLDWQLWESNFLSKYPQLMNIQKFSTKQLQQTDLILCDSQDKFENVVACAHKYMNHHGELVKNEEKALIMVEESMENLLNFEINYEEFKKARAELDNIFAGNAEYFERFEVSKIENYTEMELCHLLLELKCQNELSFSQISIRNSLYGYLMLLNAYKWLHRIQGLIQKISNPECEVTKRENMMKLYEELTEREKGAFAVEELVVFEISADFRLRNSHFDDVYFLSGIPLLSSHSTDSFNQNRILSKAMGGGKSLVMGTLLAKLLARNGKIPIVVFLSSLIMTSGRDLLRRSSDWLGQNGHFLLFDRQLVQNKKYLESLVTIMERCQVTNEYFITTPDSLMSFINASCDVLSCLTCYSELLSRIRSMISKNSIIISDEIDNMANPFNELNFVAGNHSQVSSDLIDVILRFFLSAISLKDAISIINLKHYETPVDYETYKNFLDVILPSLENNISKLKVSDKNMFLRIINGVLFVALNDVYLETYGLPGATRPGSLLAVPYKACRTPSVKSIFSDPAIIIVKTFLSHIKKGLSLDAVKFFKNCMNDIMKEQVQLGNMSPEQTSYWINMKLIFDKNIENCPKSFKQYAQFTTQQMLNCFLTLPDSQSFFMIIVGRIISKQLVYYSNYLSSNFQDILWLSSYKTIGYTGTLYNPEIFMNYKGHFEFKTDESIAPMIIASIMMKNVRIIEGTGLIRKSSDFLDDLSEDLLLDAIIDAGGSLKYVDEIELGLAARDKYKKNSILLFRPENDSLHVITKGHPMVVMKKSDEPSIFDVAGAIHDRFIYFSQDKCTGVDLKLKPDAVAIVTIGPKTILRDFLQAVMRLRELMKGQSIILYVEKAVCAKIKETLKCDLIDFTKIIEYCWLMQEVKISSELQTALIQKFEAYEKKMALGGSKDYKVMKSRDFFAPSSGEDTKVEILKKHFGTSANTSLIEYWKGRSELFVKYENMGEMNECVVNQARVQQQRQSVAHSEMLNLVQRCDVRLNEAQSFANFKNNDLKFMEIEPFKIDILNEFCKVDLGFFIHSTEELQGVSFKIWFTKSKPHGVFSTSYFLVRKLNNVIHVRLAFDYEIEDVLLAEQESLLKNRSEVLFSPDGNVLLPSICKGNIFMQGNETMLQNILGIRSNELIALNDVLFGINVTWGNMDPYLNRLTFHILKRNFKKFQDTLDKLYEEKSENDGFFNAVFYEQNTEQLRE